MMNSYLPKRISFPDLMETARSFPEEVREDRNRLTFTLAVTLITHFFGKEWYYKYVFQDNNSSKTPGYMRLEFGPDGEAKTSRLLDFAETLFNLQGVEGFDSRVDQMRAGQIEATFAEFDFGRFLYLHDIAFKFVETSGVKGRDYDCSIHYADGRVACADAKCRLEGTEARADTVLHSLNKARSQNLPPDLPGIVFVKIPQSWFDRAEVREGIYKVVTDFLRTTKRIVSVVTYTTHVRELPERKMIHMRHAFREFLSDHHRFDRSRSYALFKDYEVPDDWGGAHPKWVRVFSEGFLMRSSQSPYYSVSSK